MEIFGFEIKRKDEKQELQDKLNQKAFAPPQFDDGAVNVATGATFGQYIDIDGTVRSEAELVARYRQMALQPEVSKAVNEITNEAIVFEENKEPVELLFNDEKIVSKSIQNRINDEFKNVLDILNFKKFGYDLFKRWYIDGRIYFQVIVDELNPGEGIKELRWI